MAMSQGRSGTIKQATLNYHFNRAKALSGLTDKDLVVHSLRHTFASRLVKAGVNLAVVQKLLGHSSIVVTMRYSHLDMVDLQSAVARI
jgi:site-specific recombinase XerD